MYANSNQSLEQTDACKQEVVDRLRININLLFQRLNELPSLGTEPGGPLSEFHQRIICRSLLGYTRAEIVTIEGEHNYHAIVDALTSRIYPKLSRLLNVNDIAGKWAKIIYHLLDPQNGFRLEPLPMPIVNTLMSFGNHILFRRNNPDVSKFQQKGAQSYSIGAYFSAFESFIEAWNRDRGNPELLIYINNCLIEEHKKTLFSRGIKIYTIAIVVPTHHNLGKVATQLLYGVAQAQLQVNLQALDRLKISDITDCCNRLRQTIGINKREFDSITDRKTLIRALIVNENNKLISEGGGTFNQAARDLVQVAEELEVMAVIGHYSSEMTRQALGVYDQRELLLISPSSTSDELSNVVEMNSFLRMTTPDRIATRRIGNYLLELSSSQLTPQKVALIYNKNSSYCQSFKNAVRQYFEEHPENFYLLPECGELDDDDLQCLKYLESIQDQEASTLIIIPDGGIEPNSLNTAGIISRLGMNKCLIVGAATFYHDNVLQWTEENIRQGLLDKNNASKVVACIPWHWRSRYNGCNSANDIAAKFCKLGAALWGEGRLTWRSATAYDAVLIVARALQSYTPQNHKELRKRINQYFRHDRQFQSGVTGRIEFSRNGDRINPPTEMVAVRWNSETGRCEWLPT